MCVYSTCMDISLAVGELKCVEHIETHMQKETERVIVNGTEYNVKVRLDHAADGYEVIVSEVRSTLGITNYHSVGRRKGLRLGENVSPSVSEAIEDIIHKNESGNERIMADIDRAFRILDENHEVTVK